MEFKKYPKVKRVGDESVMSLLEGGSRVLIQEKMDGANFRFMLERHLDEEYHVDGRSLVFGSRNVAYKNEKDVDKNFEHAIKYVRENVDIDELRKRDKRNDGLIFYGEAMHPHTIDYDWSNVPSFLGFDVYTGQLDGFVDPMMVDMAFDEIGLDTVPTVGIDWAENIDADYEIPDSQYHDGVAEGVVFKNLHNRTRAKLRSEEFLEKFGGPTGDTSDPTDADRFVGTYITEYRIEKTALKLVDEGDWSGLQMEMMEDLPRAVLVDAVEEEAWDILTQNWELDMGEVRSEAASKCARVLKDVMQKRQMNDVDMTETVTYNEGDA